MLRTLKDELRIVKTIFLLLFISLLTWLKYSYFPDPIVDSGIPFVQFLVLSYVIYRYDFNFFSLYFLFVFAFLFMSFSIILIENGSYMIEVGKLGYLTGSNIKFIFFIQSFTLICYGTFCKLRYSRFYFKKTTDQTTNDFFLKIYYILYIVLLLVIASIIVKYGNPLSLGITRSKYWTSVAPPILKYLTSILPQLLIIDGITIAIYRKTKWKHLSRVLLVLNISLQILQGERFSRLFLSAYFLLLPYVYIISLKTNYRIPLKYIITSFIIFISLMILVLVNYIIVLGNYGEAIAMFVNRLSLQGQVWWATEILSSSEPNGFNFIIKHVLGVGAIEKERGLNYLMFLIAPEVASRYYDSGSIFTGGYPAIIIYGFGSYLGFLVNLLCGFFLGVVLHILVFPIKINNIMVSILCFKIFFSAYLAYVMGEVYLFPSFKTLIFLSLIIVIGNLKFSK